MTMFYTFSNTVKQLISQPQMTSAGLGGKNLNQVQRWQVPLRRVKCNYVSQNGSNSNTVPVCFVASSLLKFHPLKLEKS